MTVIDGGRISNSMQEFVRHSSEMRHNACWNNLRDGAGIDLVAFAFHRQQELCEKLAQRVVDDAEVETAP